MSIKLSQQGVVEKLVITESFLERAPGKLQSLLFRRLDTRVHKTCKTSRRRNVALRETTPVKSSFNIFRKLSTRVSTEFAQWRATVQKCTY